MPIIQKGPRGGWFYINEKEQKVYVSKGNTNKEKKTSPAKPTWGDEASFAALARLKQPNVKVLDNTVRRPRRSTRTSKKDYSPRSSRSSRSSSSASSSISSPPSGKTHKKRLRRAKNIAKYTQNMTKRQAEKWIENMTKINYLSSYDEAWFQEQALRKKMRAIAKIAAGRGGKPVRRIKTRNCVRRPQIRRGKVVPPPKSLIRRSRFLPFGWIIDENGRTIPIPELLSKTPTDSKEAKKERARRETLRSAIAEGRIKIISPVGLAPHSQNRGKYRRILTGPTLQDFFAQQGLVGHLGPTKFLIADYLKERPNMSKVLMME